MADPEIDWVTVHARNAEYNTMAERIHKAIENGDQERLQRLLEADQARKSIDVPWRRRTPLENAAWYRRAGCIRILIEAGANVNLVNDENTALLFACRRNSIECMEILLAAGADPNLPKETDGTWCDAPLHAALRTGVVEYVDLLITHGADVSRHSFNGTTPLEYACMYNYRDVASLLLRRGAPMDADWRHTVYTERRADIIAELGGAEAIRKEYQRWLESRGVGRNTKSASKTNAAYPHIISALLE